MVTIAEEKKRRILFNMLLYISLVGLFISSDNSETTVTIGLAVTASIGYASALYSKFRIEMLSLIGKNGKAE